MITDEVMAGFGRTGRWFAVDHWDVVPDLMTMAKGLTSSYLPLGAVAMSPEIADYFNDQVYYGGLTYSAHPISCAAAIAAVSVLRDDDLVGNAARLGVVMREPPDRSRGRGTRAWAPPAASACSASSSWSAIAETKEPMAPFNASSPEMAALEARLRADGLYTMQHWNQVFTNPPLCITEEQLREGFADHRSGARRHRCRGRLSDRDDRRLGDPTARIGRRRRLAFFALFIIGLVVLWEGFKLLGGDP